MLVSVVIPCYNSEKSIRDVVELTMAEFDAMRDYEVEFVLVNDYSRDDTFGQIIALANEYPNVHGINLMRNFGQHNALMCAMNYTHGDLILGMDDDFQTHPSQIPLILAKQREGYDLVYGVYDKSLNSKGKNLTSWFNRVSSRLLLGRPKEISSSNFWLITDKVRQEVIRYRNYNPYVDGLFFRTTHNIGNVTIHHHKREFGSSNYTLRKMMKLWMAYWNYSILPLRAASVLGAFTAVIGFIAAVGTVVHKLIDPSTPMGWASTVSIMLIFFGFTMLVLGIIGEYIGEIVLSISQTPQYVVRDMVNIPEEDCICQEQCDRYSGKGTGTEPSLQKAEDRVN